MKRAKAFDKETGQFISMMRADSITEETRYAYDYRCAEEGCNCATHWRRQVDAKGNTDIRPATFVKNKSSRHADGCVGDLHRIMHENIDYTTIKNGQIHVRVNFPLGSDPIDRHPLRGYLSNQYMAAAEAQKIIKPFGHIKELLKFIEKNFKRIDSDAAKEIILNYQGKTCEWGKILIESDRYDRLYRRSINKRTEEGINRSPAVSIVRPLRRMTKSENGNARFECEEQTVKIDGIRQRITPIIICDKFDRAVEKKVEWLMNQKQTAAIVARPYNPAEDAVHIRSGEQKVRLFVRKMEQIEAIDDAYWRYSEIRRNQRPLFPEGPQP